MKASPVRFVAVLLATSSLGCGRDNIAPSGPLPPAGPPIASNQVLATNATVRFVSLEGGCWALETAAGTYEPTSLPAPFRTDGLPVYVVARGAPLLSVCQIGPLVTLDTIRTR